MYYAILPPEISIIGCYIHHLNELKLECPEYCQTEEEAVQYLTNTGNKRFKLYKQQVEFVAEYEPQEQPVVRKVVPEQEPHDPASGAM